jgi:hypothetical protein
MRMINAKFIAGMLAMALVFGMIGCDTGTNTVTKTVPGPGSTTTVTEKDKTHPFSATTPEQLNALVALGAKAPIYVTESFEATADIELAAGQTIVIADQAYANAQPKPNESNIQLSLGGPVSYVVKLTIPQGITLTVASGAAVVVGDPGNAAKTGVLLIQGGGGLTVKDGATLGVTKASRVLVEKPDSGAAGGLDLQAGSSVLALGTSLENEALIDHVTPSSDADPLIAIEKDDSGASAPAIISSGAGFYTIEGGFNEENLTVDGLSNAAKEVADAVMAVIADKVEAITNDSPAKETDDPSKIAGLFTGSDGIAAATEVTYTSTDALGTVSVPADKKLIIKGAVEDGSNAITLGNGAALEIAGGASLDLGDSGTITKGTGATVTNNGTIKTATDISLVTAAGTGTIVITGTPTAATADIALTQNLEIADTATLDLSTHSFTGAGKVTNKGLIKTAVTGTESGAKLNALIAKAGGKIEASGTAISVAANTELTVVSGATLAVASGANLTVAANATIAVADKGILDLTALHVADESGPTAGDLNGVATINGTIEVASGGTYKSPAPSLAEEVVYGSNGKLKLNAGSTAYIGTIPYIGANGATAALTWTEANPTGGYVLIDGDGMTLGGNGKLSHLAYESPTYDALNSFYITGKVTIDAGSVLTIGPTSGELPDASIKLGNATGSGSGDELVLKGTVELNTTGYLSVLPTGTLTVAATGTIKHKSTGKVTATVCTPSSWEPKPATVETEGSVHTVTGVASNEAALDITLGTVKISSEATAVNVNLSAAEPAAAGTLKAATGTQILFLGVN